VALNKKLDQISITVKRTSVVFLTPESDYSIFNYVIDRVSRPYSGVDKSFIQSFGLNGKQALPEFPMLLTINKEIK
jgi:hypothetical protein